jgi:hypothetical protein
MTSDAASADEPKAARRRFHGGDQSQVRRSVN